MTKSVNQDPKPVGVVEWYDFIGQLADILPGLHLGGKSATYDLLQMLNLNPESRVLDVGCGSGNTACMIAREYGSRVQGIDFSEVMITQAKQRIARQNLSGKVRFLAANIYNLPFSDHSFDAALAESVLTPLVGDKEQALREIVRVLRPGGCLGVNESTFDSFVPSEYLALLNEHPAIHGHFTTNHLIRLFEQVGLDAVQTTVTKISAAPGAIKEMGWRGLLAFMIRVYPKILIKLMRDARFRKASKIDDQITKTGKPYMSYTLIVGTKRG